MQIPKVEDFLCSVSMVTFVSGKSDAGDYYVIRRAAKADAVRMAPVVNAAYLLEEESFIEGNRTSEENIISIMESSNVSRV